MSGDVSRETVLRLVVKDAEPRELAESIARHAVELLARPSFRAGVTASAITGALCMRAGMRPAAALVLMMMAHASAERLWTMAEDMHQAAVAQSEYLRKIADAGLYADLCGDGGADGGGPRRRAGGCRRAWHAARAGDSGGPELDSRSGHAGHVRPDRCHRCT